MCGICGFYGFKNDALLQNMLRKIAHRGPDGVGFYSSKEYPISLGHRRLSIIDLSDRAAQPFFTEDNACVLVFNGEIYNYQLLRSELMERGYSFHSESDSEVLLNAYKEWGKHCLHRMKGMFAFAIWDERSKLLFCARDRLGIKPFYYYWNYSKFIFASEIKSILEFDELIPEVNQQIAYDYLKRGLIDHSSDTFFRGITKLGAGEYLILQNKALLKERYWELPEANSVIDTNDYESIGEFKRLFMNSLKEHLISDVPVGSCLSGGLDSSAIVSALSNEKNVNKDLFQTFSYVSQYREHDESHFIDICSKHTHLKNNKVELCAADIPRLMGDVVYHQEEPFGSTGIFLQWAVMERAKQKGVKVLLDGQGADEILAGYRKYRLYLMREQIDSRKPISALLTAVRALPHFKTSFSFHNDIEKITNILNGKSFKRKNFLKFGMEIGEDQTLQTIIKSIQEGSKNDLTRISLPALLRYEDKNSMAHSIEARVPFLDHELVEYVYSLDSSKKLRNGTSKWIMREAFKGVLPEKIRNRKDKMGFVASEDRWLKENHQFFLEVLKKNSQRIEEFVDVPELIREADLAFSMPLKYNLWRYINFAAWHERFIP